MYYTPKCLQNQSGWSDNKPAIVITIEDELWEEAFSHWKSGKDPTASVEWKKGVYLLFESITKDTQ